MATAKEIVSRVDRLASLPAVYFRIRKVVSDPDASVADLSKAISADPDITARLLRVVNSSYFGLPGRVGSVSIAVTMIGMQQVHDIVLATSLATTFAGVRPAHMDMTRYWRDSLFRGLASRCLAMRRRVRDPERLFIEGLLSDIGHLVMYMRLPVPTAHARQISRDESVPLYRVERETIGCDYAQVGAALLDQWNLPPAICATVAEHAELPVTAESHFEAAIVHIASHLADWAEDGGAAIADSAWEYAGLSPDDLPAVAEQAQDALADAVALFFPSFAVAA